MMHRSVLASLCLLTGCGTGLFDGENIQLHLNWASGTCSTTFSGTTVGCLDAAGTGYIGGSSRVVLTLSSGRTPTPAVMALDADFHDAETPLNIPGISCASDIQGPEIDVLTGVLIVNGRAKDTTTLSVACQKATRN